MEFISEITSILYELDVCMKSNAEWTRSRNQRQLIAAVKTVYGKSEVSGSVQYVTPQLNSSLITGTNTPRKSNSVQGNFKKILYDIICCDCLGE